MPPRRPKLDIEALSRSELTQFIKEAKARLKVLAKQSLTVKAGRKGSKATSAKVPAKRVADDSTTAREAVKRARRKLGKVAPKYRDPDNARNTWTGRGRQPRWLAEKVRRGQRAADFLIPGLAKPTANARGVGQRSVFKAS